MASASAVARYFLSLSDEEAGDTISNLKLQKLLYYAQGFHLALFGEPLFNEDIRAWTHGPVVVDVYHEYKGFGSSAIPRPQDFDPQQFSKDIQELLDEVYNVYGQYSAWKLRNMTHSEPPWANAYAAGAASIPLSSMRDFFRTLTQ